MKDRTDRVVRRTKVTADLATREFWMDGEERSTLYIGEEKANELTIRLLNRGRPVDPKGYVVMSSYILPTRELVTNEAKHLPDGCLREEVPGRVYTVPGRVRMSLALINHERIVLTTEINLYVRERREMLTSCGRDVGNLLPSVAQMLMMLRRVEVALGYIDPDDKSGKLIADKVEDLEAHRDRPEGFATAAQGARADAALPAAQFTEHTILEKLIRVTGGQSGLNADTVDGLHASAFATAAQGARADAALPASQYTAADVLAKLKSVQGAGSGLHADYLGGYGAGHFATAEGLSQLWTAQSQLSTTLNQLAASSLQLVVGSVAPAPASNVIFVQV